MSGTNGTSSSVVNIIWSKSYGQPNAYNSDKTESIASVEQIVAQILECKNVLWIRNTSYNRRTTTDLDHLAGHLNKLRGPIVLITSDGDRPVPSSYRASTVNRILKHPNIRIWLTQNYDKTKIHPKLGHYPIGLDLHTQRWLDTSIQNRNLQRLAKTKRYLIIREMSAGKKANRIFVDSHLSVTHPRREYMFNTLQGNALVHFLQSMVSHTNIIKAYASYRFVVSPIGNGLDCHRTWEIMLLGSIPILESSSLDEMFTAHNLPVIIVPDFKVLNDIDENQLNSWWTQQANRIKSEVLFPKFTPDYWVNAFLDRKSHFGERITHHG